MERELDFPNPIERSDLPVPRKKWKYVVGALGMMLVIGIVFLPQIISSRIGRNLVKLRLESKYRGQVWVTGLKTSWSGPTTISQFSLTDPEGRQIKFASLESGMSLWGLLMGNFELKDAKITGLQAEYVIDYGDGTDTFDRLPDSYIPGLIADPTAGKKTPSNLPKLSGNVTLKNATFILTRGQVLGDKQYRIVYRSAKFSNINGTVKIESLDKPFACEIEGLLDAEEGAGHFELTGSASLGADGHLDPAKAQSDLWLKMQNVPNGATQGAGSLGWILLPVVPAEDYAVMFGPTLSSVQMNIQAAGGKLRLAKFEARGKTKAGKETRVAGEPVVNLLASPKTVEVDGPTTARVQMTPELSRRLAYLDPFLRNAAEKTGELDLVIDKLAMPIVGSQRKMSASGSLAVKDLLLQSGPLAPTDSFPSDLTTQWQAITGDTAATITMNQASTRFKIDGGRVEFESTPILLDGKQVVLSGPISLSGTLQLHAKIAAPMGMVDASIGGTVEKPVLELLNPSPQSKEEIAQHLALLRQRKSEQLLDEKTKQVEAMIKGVDRVNPGGTIPGKSPAWEKANWKDPSEK
jgi:hypothetical protein